MLKWIRHQPLARQPLILVLSSIDDSGLRIKLLEAGADEFMGKPFNPRELTVRINAQLRWRYD